jgi:Protein of unknown function (DUF4232)
MPKAVEAKGYLALMRNRLLGLACLACSTAILAVGGVPAAAITGPPRCRTASLVVWMKTEGSGAAGSIYYQLQLTNLSGRACVLSGYPGVSAVSLSGRQLGRSATRQSGEKAHTLTLKNGASATATLRIVEARNFPANICRPVAAAGLRVYPPDQKTAKSIPFPFEACAGGGPAILGVGPLKAS